MVTRKSSHKIESLEDEGVGGTLVAVAVGDIVGVAVAGTAVGSLAEEQAVISENAMNRNKGDFFIRNI